jgi:hypothetical protein
VYVLTVMLVMGSAGQVIGMSRNVNWAKVNLEKVRPETKGVVVWIRHLGVPLCRQRMEYCAKMDLAPSSKILLAEFKDLFENLQVIRSAKKDIPSISPVRSSVCLLLSWVDREGGSGPLCRLSNWQH